MSNAELSIGPWIGVPRESQRVCAVEGCEAEGRPHRCPWAGRRYHHGCVHYFCEAAKPAVKRAGFKFREGWALLCDRHYDTLMTAIDGGLGS